MTEMLTPNEWVEGIREAIAAVWFAFERLSEATTLPEQTQAYSALANAMSDLATWHDQYNLHTGRIELPDEYEIVEISPPSP